MTIQRLYISQNLENKNIYITDEDFHYLKNVIRLKVDDEILLFNEKNGEYLSRVSEITKKQIVITPIKQTRTPESEKLNDTELIFSPIRHNRQDLIVEKTTELGIKILSPVITAYTNNKNLNIERLNTIAKEATEQSRRLSKPIINNLETFTEKIAKLQGERAA